MNLLIQFPTYARAEKFLRVLEKYVTTCTGLHNVFFNINCDAGDLTMVDKDVQEKVYSILNSGPPIISGKLNFDQNTEKISAINDNIDNISTDCWAWDVVVCASDDMVPKVFGWDNDIATAMKVHFPNLDGCVHFNDGNTNGDLITFSILGRKLYERFGYVYHPDYKSLYCDNEFTDEVRRMGCEQYIDKIIISHEHWSIKGSENDGEVDLAVQKTLHYSGRDKDVYEKRKALGFPKERITQD